MSFSSKVLYTGDAVTTDFTVTFPYLSKSHVSVYVNEILQLPTMNYNWSGASTISFTAAPRQDDAIVIRRWTSPTATLVDFVDGSTLRAGDLDTAYLHNYYLSQEYADSFNEVINEMLVKVATSQGIVETDPDEIIAQLVTDMLDSENAANLQARIGDIDANAEAIITLGESLQVQINTLAQGTAAAVYVQPDEPVPGVGEIPNPIPAGARWYDSDDNNKPYIYEDSAWVSIEDPRIGVAEADIKVLSVNTENTNAALVDEMYVRATETTALSQRMALLGATAGDNSAFILDLDTAKVSETESLAERFTSITAATDANSAAITSEQIARANADGVIAADLNTVETTVDGHTTTITSHTASIDGLEGEYGVAIDNNNHVAGFTLNNSGVDSSAFVIAVDKFAVANATTQKVPFEIVGTKINMRADVQIDGDLIVSGTINGTSLINGTIGSTQIGSNAISTTHISASAITANEIATNAVTSGKINVTNLEAVNTSTGSLNVDGTLTMGNTGKIRGGATSYASGTGFFLGYDTGSPAGYKFRIGNTTDNFLKWDGSKLEVIGDILVGEYAASSNTILSATTERTKLGVNYTRKKSFTVDRAGTVRVSYQMKRNFNGGLSNGYTSTNVRIYKGSSIVHTDTQNDTTYTTKTYDISVSAGTTIHLDLQGGTYWNSGDQALEPATGYIRNAYIQADVALTTGGSVDLN